MSSRPLLFGGVLACIFILLWSGSQPACSTMAKDERSVHIVYVEKSPDHLNDVENHHLGILSQVTGGSLDAAKEHMLYSYSQAMSGFSAKLTPDQVESLKGVPGVVQIVKDQVHHIASENKGVGGSGPRVTKVGGNVISSLGDAANLQ
ncbi:subtilisin-like protease SBT3.5 [Physcomitrium patens]|nr:subtilisin-like protease SBT3.5 isoform X2 [Physcomitrium patens]XP_024360994.1 subtilisin-like protease SBT3.5 isoform X2 [Physcomitrium patens]XP_024360995.1 subtilisin-like protease SBT3.5 isoform X2 [Physcomitrium patens]XP_024360996.1 subtilisin-like protease SBT3.5 isoform X2 [Physcomitrium patens]XP_024360997.1 subtilisin-like protease SBT3.5 isoform X2 [Physcomitrium patens]|eukprot:XP_024360993.1 subtilisin-like protease SBT3.5 isoform X2 [Physcomitrella patens]